MRSTAPTHPAPHHSRVFYDAECGLCQAGVAKHSWLFKRCGVRFEPLQTPGTATCLGISETELRREMKIQLADGRVLGGVDAWSALLRSVWWLWPFGAAMHVPGVHALAGLVYRWIAAHRHQFAGSCRLPDSRPRQGS